MEKGAQHPASTKDGPALMPPGYHIANDDGLISIQVADEIDLAELYELAKSVLSSTDYAAELPLLADLRGMRLELNRDAAKPFSNFVINNFRNRPVSMAVVIDGDMNRELSAAIYWLACAVGRTEVFDDYDHALKWLIRREFAHSPPPNIADHVAASSNA